MVFRARLFLVYAVLCLLSLYNTNAFSIFKSTRADPRIVGFSWSNCGPATDSVKINSLSVAPDPLKIPGNITVSTVFAIATADPTDIEIQVEIEAKVAGFWIKVPCVDNFGSCTYGGLCKSWVETCPKYFEKYGIPCVCPIPPNTYTISDFEADITQKIPVTLKGDVRLTGNIVSPTGGHIACLQIEIKIQS